MGIKAKGDNKWRFGIKKICKFGKTGRESKYYFPHQVV